MRALQQFPYGSGTGNAQHESLLIFFDPKTFQVGRTYREDFDTGVVGPSAMGGSREFREGGASSPIGLCTTMVGGVSVPRHARRPERCPTETG
ncbi:hypothetical protein [Streptomyces sp. NPDC005476]|uniref:hypothetical protein n=1 Tax=Streptomyces sp. NPDC005476 TaxID=3156882 RepID=UPI00345353D8